MVTNDLRLKFPVRTELTFLTVFLTDRKSFLSRVRTKCSFISTAVNKRNHLVVKLVTCMGASS